MTDLDEFLERRRRERTGEAAPPVPTWDHDRWPRTRGEIHNVAVFTAMMGAVAVAAMIVGRML